MNANEDPFDLPAPNRKTRRAKKAVKRKKKTVKTRTKKLIVPKSAVPEETLKHFVAMARDTVAPGRGRVWMCDGEYVAIRRKGTNEHTVKRQDAMISRGEMVHVLTSDDVSFFQLTDLSPFKRKQPMNLATVQHGQLVREIATAAVGRDWELYVDGLQEAVCRFRANYDPGTATLMFTEFMDYLNANIAMRGGPGEQERIYQKDLVMQRRGQGRARMIALPAQEKRLVRV